MLYHRLVVRARPDSPAANELAMISHRPTTSMKRKPSPDAARTKCKECSSAMHPRSVETLALATVGQLYTKTPFAYLQLAN